MKERHDGSLLTDDEATLSTRTFNTVLGICMHCAFIAHVAFDKVDNHLSI